MRAPITKNIYQSRGFTLIEVISVVVILSIVAVLGTKFVAETSKSYQSTQVRSRLFNTSRLAIESMSRQLRIALPYSLRVTNSNTCIEFLPIVGGGSYLDPVPDSVNGAAAASTINVSPHTVDFGSAQYVSIGAASDTEVYGASPVSRATLNSRTAILLTLSAAKSWQRNSINQHFFLLDAPQAFCVVSGQLRYYSGLDVTSASVNTASSYSLLSTNVTSATPFSLSAGSENRNVNILFDITFVATNGEAITLNQSVIIRNVP